MPPARQLFIFSNVKVAKLAKLFNDIYVSLSKPKAQVLDVDKVVKSPY